jgi:hypothetical protein
MEAEPPASTPAQDCAEMLRQLFGTSAAGRRARHAEEEDMTNLHRLKQVMEEGSVTDTSYSVPGKFAQAPSLRRK